MVRLSLLMLTNVQVASFGPKIDVTHAISTNENLSKHVSSNMNGSLGGQSWDVCKRYLNWSLIDILRYVKEQFETLYVQPKDCVILDEEKEVLYVNSSCKCSKYLDLFERNHLTQYRLDSWDKLLP